MDATQREVHIVKHTLKPLFLFSLVAAALLGLVGCGGRAAAAQLLSPQAVYDRLPDLDDDTILLDVRTPEEWAEGHIEGATLLPLDALPSYAASLLPNKEAEIIVYCRSGNRSTQAVSYRVDAGYQNVSDMQGGILAWIEAGLPVVMTP